MALSLGGSITLARLLDPEDYGINALVTMMTGLFFVFSEVGLSLATVQKKELTSAEISSAFWLQLLVSSVVAMIAALLAPIFAWIYDESRLTLLVWTFAPTFVVLGLYAQPQALARREMRFGVIATIEIVAAALALAIAIIAAMHGAGYWSLVAQTIAQLSLPLPAYWLVTRWRPSRPRIGREILPHVTYSGPFFAHRLLDYAAKTADKGLLGWHFGPEQLGFYERAMSILAAPMSQLTMPLTHALLPALSRLQDDPKSFKRLYLGSLTLLTWLTMPMSGFLVGAAEDVVLVVLGPKWTAATPVFQFASIAAALTPVAATRAWILLPLGHSNRVFRFGLVSSVALFGAMLVLAPFGPTAVAAGTSVWVSLVLFTGLKYAIQGTAISMGEIGRAVAPAFAVAVIVVGIGRLSSIFDSGPLRLAMTGSSVVFFGAVGLVASGHHRGLRTALHLVRSGT